jgi:PII-like signaling protein
MSSTNETVLTEDYLDEDKPLRHKVTKQLWCVLSMLTPNSFPESKREQYKDQKVLGVKVRGVYEEASEASERASNLQKIDKYHHVFVGEVGKWLPFDVDVSNMGSEDQVYREQSLNKYMKSYKDSLHEEVVEETKRKEDMLQGAKVVTGTTVFDKSSTCESATVESVSTTVPTTVETVSTSVSVSVSSTVENELEKNETEKKRLQEQLSSSKASLEGLEEKLNTISDLYSKLKSS